MNTAINSMAAAMNKVGAKIKEVSFTECLPLGRTFATRESAKFGEYYNTAEALVAWDTATGFILKFIATYIPGETPTSSGKYHGIMPDGRPAWPQKVEPQRFTNEAGEEFTERPNLRPAFLDFNKLPAKPGVEFRLLRVYRRDVQLAQRCEILNFQVPPPPYPRGSDTLAKKERSKTIRRSLTVEDCWPDTPPLAVYDNPYHREILKGLSKFAGCEFVNTLALAATVQASGGDPTELLKDESADEEEPVNIQAMGETVAPQDEPVDEPEVQTEGITDTIQVEEEEPVNELA
jgi:hypothetical protein